MEISINANYLLNYEHKKGLRPVEEAIKICADAGFKVLDYSPFMDVYGNYDVPSNWRERAKEIRAAADARGVCARATPPGASRRRDLPPSTHGYRKHVRG